MQQQVAFVQGLEHTAGRIHSRRRLRRPALRKQMLKAWHPRPCHVRPKIQRTIHKVNSLAPSPRQRAQKLEQARSQPRRHFQPYGVAFLPRLNHLLHLLRQIQHIVVMHRNVAVASQPKQSAGPYLLTREKNSQKMHHHFPERDTSPSLVRQVR